MGDKVKDVVMVEVKWSTRLSALGRSRPWCRLHEPVGVKSTGMATGLEIERGQSQEIQSSVIGGHNGRLAKDQPMRSSGGVSKAESRDTRVPPSIAVHVVVLLTNPGTPAGGTCVGADAESTMGHMEWQVPRETQVEASRKWLTIQIWGSKS